MKYLMILIFIAASSSAFAHTHKRKHKKHKAHRRHQVVTHYVDHTPKPSLGTNFYFNAVTVHGHYESPDESIVTVEDDKKLGDLLDYRTNYRNRLADEIDGGVR